MTRRNPEERKRDVMLFIQMAYARDGFMPTLDQIAQGVGVSGKGRMHTIVSELIDAGYLARDARKSRGLTILRRVPDDRLEEAAKQVCSALGVVTPDNIKTATAAIYAALMPAEAA